MNEYLPLPSLAHLKQQARRLRVQVEGNGPAIGHSRSLELLAHQYGYKDWNTLHAAVGNTPPGPSFSLGSRVSGLYLGHPFEGEIIAIQTLQHSSGHRITIYFDRPVDVVKFEGWSAMRRRVTARIGTNGCTVEKTSNGAPIMELDI